MDTEEMIEQAVDNYDNADENKDENKDDATPDADPDTTPDATPPGDDASPDAGSDDEPDEPSDEPEDDEDEPEPVKSEAKDISEYDTAEAYVADKLPTIETYGTEGETGKVKKFTIKSAADLPDDFMPRSYKDQQILSEQLSKQARTAEKLAEEYGTTKAENESEQYRQQLEASWQSEIDAATKAGDLPEIKAKEGDPGYWEDPGVKAVAEVIQFMMDENKRLEQANSPYRVQSFAQAQRLYKAEQASAAAAEAAKKEAQVNKERGSMVGSGKGSSDNANFTPPPPGTTIEDILNRHMDD